MKPIQKEEPTKKKKISEMPLEEKLVILTARLEEMNAKLPKLKTDIQKYEDKYQMKYMEFLLSNPRRGEETDDKIDWGFLENAKDEMEAGIKKIKRFLKKNLKV